MKIIIDDKIPYIQGVFENFAEVLYVPGKATTAAMARDADALITRTRTQCNADLLCGSHVKMIATATIGYDHIDRDFCADNNIKWQNAPGCNADAVVQYVFAALGELLGNDLSGKVLGVVGVGNVGSRVANFAERLGMTVLRNDPPRVENEGPEGFVSLAEVQQKADIITFHTPLTRDGKYPTYHLCDQEFVAALAQKVLIINAARGEVTDSEALLDGKKNARLSHLVIDCWENEPRLNARLLEQADIATFHIAGYSMEGKANATTMAVQALNQFFQLGLDGWKVELPENPNAADAHLPLMEQVRRSYAIMDDDAALRAATDKFEQLRGAYNYRRQPVCL